jgi:serine/threonine protein kinase/Tol biopolymer transport system component
LLVLGRYLLGGVVYRARDTRLDREAAIKALPEELAEDSERLTRFEREAKLLASLNNPHIATVYGLEEVEGRRFLAMELVEGENLAERLAKGPIPVQRALELAQQIAEALEAAHESGVVHRDVKPGNIMIGEHGKAKVLDFGLATELQTNVPGAGMSLSPTLPQPMTLAGQILGTPVYMSPEQAKGKEASRQSDIWAFGCVLYEMLTGKRAFQGPIVGEGTADPDWEALPDRTPALVRRLIRRCLQRDLRRRLHDIADVRIEIQDALGPTDEALSVSTSDHPPAATSKRLRATAWIASLLAAAALTWLAVELLSRRSPTATSQPGAELQIRQLTGRPSSDTVHTAALSPDGEQLAFATREGLFLQLVGTGEERLLDLPEGLQVLEVDWLGPTELLFSASTGDALGLYKTSIFGGKAPKLTDGAWRAAGARDGSRVAYLEGVPSRTVTVVGPDGEDGHIVLDLGRRGAVWEIAWSPDGRWLLVGIWGGATNPHDTVLEAIDLESEERRPVLADPRLFQNWRAFLPFFWTPDDRLVLGRRELAPNQQTANLWQAPIDGATATLVGDLERLTQVTGTNPKDLSATEDGRRMAFLQEHSQSDVLVAELKDGGQRLGEVRHVTVDQRNDQPIAWSRDGRLLFISSLRTGAWSLFRKPLEGGTAEFLTETGEVAGHSMEISRDGGFALFWRGSELSKVPTAGGPAETVLSAGVRPGIWCNAAGDGCLVGERSPDELAYVFSDFDLATGRGNEVLRIEDRPPFTNWDVSPDGSRLVVGHNDDRLRIFDLATGEETVLTDEGLSYGEFPVWSADGRGVFVDGGYATRGRLQKGLLYVSLEDGKVHVLRLNWGEWDIHPVPSADGKRLAFAANFFYDGNAWMVEEF